MPGWAVTIAATSAERSASSRSTEARSNSRSSGDEGIVVGEVRSQLAQHGDDLQRRRLADVADPGLVADPEQQHPGALDRLLGLVEGAGDPVDAVGGLGAVDFPGQLDELGVEVVLARLEGEVEGVDRQAVAAHPRAGVEAHEPERLGRRGFDHLPDVDPEPVAELGKLVDEGDVDRAEDVLEQLRQLRCLRRGEDDDLAADQLVQLAGSLGAGFGQAADQLRRGAHGVVGAARVDPLR